MTNWLGKFWLLRLALWLFAAALCLLVWPVATPEMYWRYWYVSQRQFQGDVHDGFGNPILRAVSDGAIEAWDWQTNRRWRVPLPLRSSLGCYTVFRDGRAHAAVTVDKENGVAVTEIAPPHTRRTRPLPSGFELRLPQPVLLDESLSFVLLLKGRLTDRANDLNKLYVADLQTGRVVEDRSCAGEIYNVGNSEFEIVDLDYEDGTWQPGKEPVSVRSTRWKLTPKGELVASDTPPMVDLEVYSKRFPPLTEFVSRDKRFEATLPQRSGRVYVREAWNGRLLEKLRIPPVEGIAYLSFSLDSKYFLVGGPSTSFHVFDLESQTLVANDHHVERRHWYVGVLTTIAAVGFLTAIGLSLRTHSFERAAWDYLLATVFFELLVTTLAFAGDWFSGGYTGMGTAFAIGLYLALAKQPLWTRVICGTLGVAVLLCTYFWVVANSPRLTHSSHSPLMNSLMLMPVASAAAALLVTKPFGWRIAQGQVAAVPGRVQWGIGNICLWMAIAAIFSASARQIVSEEFDEGWIEVVLRVGTHFGVLLLAGLIVSALSLWLWFRRFDWFSLVIVIAIGLGIVAVGYQSLRDNEVIDLSKPDEINITEAARFALFSVTPLVLGIARLSFPLWLARRHGYHWVKITRPIPATDGASRVTT